MAQGNGRANGFTPPYATMHYARDRDFHDRHLSLVLDVHPDTHSADGTVTHTIVALRDGISTIEFDAGANLKIEQCWVNSQARPFKHEGERLLISPVGPLPRGRDTVVRIRYAMPGGGRFGGANGSAGWHWIDANPNDPERQPGFWTQGETDGNHHWVPCYDYPNDKCTSDETVTIPAAWECIGNGSPGPTTVDAAHHTKTVRWVMTQPHSTYLLSLVGGELDIRKSEWAGVPLYYVVPKGKAWMIPGSFGNTPDMLQFFSTLVGFKYPWPKYAEDAMIDFGGGMENVSATTLGAGSLTDMRSGHYAMSSLDSHELAHQWFGDCVTCADWGNIWLNESFATFFQMLYTEHLDGKDAYDLDRANNLRGYLAESRSYKRPISTKLYSDPNVVFDRHSYPKGGLVLHMLRRYLGDANLFRGLGHYLRTDGFTPVDTHDLEKAITREIGINVEPFFDQWIFKPGHPVLAYSWTYDDAGKAVVLDVKQVQDTSGGTPVYNLPLGVALLSDASDAVDRTTVTLDKAVQEFRLPAQARPDALLIDPDHDLIKEVSGPEWSDAELPVIVKHAPCVVDRLEAIRRISAPPPQAQAGPQDESGLPPASTVGEGGDAERWAPLFAAQIARERSDAAAASMITALGRLKRDEYRDLFREQARTTQSQRCAAAISALEQLPSAPSDVALFRSIASSDTAPYAVVEPAMRALARWDLKGSAAVLAHQASERSAGDQLASTAVNIFSFSDPDAGVPVFLAATGPTHSVAVRNMALDALGRATVAEPRIEAVLASVVRSDSEPPAVQEEAIMAFRSRKDKSAIPLLERAASTNKSQEVRDAARRAVDDLNGK